MERKGKLNARKEYLSSYRFGHHGPEKGKPNEDRAYLLMKELVNRGVIKDVKRATRKQDKKGVDLWVYPVSEIEGFRIPFQVKSSLRGVDDFRRKNKKPGEIAVIVVNDIVDDKTVKRRIVTNIKYWMLENEIHAGMAEVVNAPV